MFYICYLQIFYYFIFVFIYLYICIYLLFNIILFYF